MATKLGYHVQGWTPGTLQTVLQARAPILKVMANDVGPVLDVARAVPTVTLVLRKYFDDGEQRALLDAREAGGKRCALEVVRYFERLIAELPSRVRAQVYVEGLNEIGLWDDAAAYSAFTVGFAETCRALGVRPAVYSFATGNPPGYRDGSREDLAAYWAHYHEGLEAAREANGVLALHEYDAPTMRRLAGWLCLRYRKVWEALPERLRLPVIITECGIDGGVLGAPIESAGWRGYTTEHDYARELAWYDDELLKDPGVIGATIFTAGNLDKWTSFDVTNVWPVADLIRARAEAMDVLVLPASPEPPARVPETVETAVTPPAVVTGDAVIRLVVARARREAWLPLVALGIAESNLRSDARRPASRLRDEEFWPDVSFGVWQQAVRWSEEYLWWARERGHDPAVFPGSSVVDAIGRRYCEVETALVVAERRLVALGLRSHPVVGWGDDDALLDLLCRYNRPMLAPERNPHRERYRRSIAEARRRLAALGVTMVPETTIGRLRVFDVRELFGHGYGTRALGDIVDISIHHTVTTTLPEDASVERELAMLRAIHAYHTQQYRGLAYHHVVFPSGRVYLTGAWDTVRYTVGGARNRTNLSVALAGTFSETPPGERQRRAARELVEHIWLQYGAVLPVLGHGEIAATQCPGATWPQWRDELVRGSTGPSPASSGPAVDAVRVQLDALWGWSERVPEPARSGIQAAVRALKDALGR